MTAWNEELLENSFMKMLRKSFENLYRLAADPNEETLLLVPCSECLQEELTQVFMETHIVRAACVPGCYTNFRGQGVDVKDSSVATQLGFSDQRTCEVLESKSLYDSDYSCSFRVLVLDRPLTGRYRPIPGVADRGQPTPAAGTLGVAAVTGGPNDSADPSDWLSKAPAIEDYFTDQLDHFRKTFVQVPGCEQSTAERIRELVFDCTKQLRKHHGLGPKQFEQHRQLDYHISRNAYACLHSFIFPHLMRILARDDHRLESAISSYKESDLLDSMPSVAGQSLALIDMRGCVEKLELLDHKITPHDKIECIYDGYSALQRCVAEGSLQTQRPQQITGDDIESLFILAVHRSTFQHRLAHVAHVEMYHQGSDNGNNNYNEAWYAVTVLQSALQFFLEDRKGPNVMRMGARPTTKVFSSFLQPGGASNEADIDLNRAGSDLQGLVRQARAQDKRR